jgi:hypothetical protein
MDSFEAKKAKQSRKSHAWAPLNMYALSTFIIEVEWILWKEETNVFKIECCGSYGPTSNRKNKRL